MNLTQYNVTTTVLDGKLGYFLNDELIAIDNEGLRTIFPTNSVDVAEVYNEMLNDLDTIVQFSFNKEGSYLIDDLFNKVWIDKHFSFKIPKGGNK